MWIQMRLPVGAGLLFIAFLLCHCAPRRVSAGSCELNHSQHSDPSVADVSIKVAVVGAGAAGSSAAWFVKDLLKEKVKVVVFEKDVQVGGRVRDIVYEGHRLEVGASIFHKSNYYFKHFAEMFQLEKRSEGHSRHDAKRLGVWDGIRFTWQSSSWSALTMASMLYHYGLSPYYAQRLASETLSQFLTIYNRLGTVLPVNSKAKLPVSDGAPFRTVEELLSSISLFNLSQISFEKALTDAAIGDRYKNELITGMIKVNYGQSLEVNALVGLVSMIGSSDDIDAVIPGNARVIENVLIDSQAEVRLQSNVQSISARPDVKKKFNVTWVATMNNGSKAHSEYFDYVVIAAPLEFANILFDVGAAHDLMKLPGMQPREYKLIHVTLVSGILRGKYFGYDNTHDIPAVILTTANAALPFNSIGAWKPVNASAGHYIWKLFSRDVVSESLLDEIFEHRKPAFRHAWNAYPVLTPVHSFPPFILFEGLYYVPAMESAFSCIESEMISSRNAAYLLFDNFLHNDRSQSDAESIFQCGTK